MIRELKLLKLYGSFSNANDSDLFIVYQVSKDNLVIHYNTDIIKDPNRITIELFFGRSIIYIGYVESYNQTLYSVILDSEEIMVDYNYISKIINSKEGIIDLLLMKK